MKTDHEHTSKAALSPHPLIESVEKRWKRFRRELKKAQKSFSEISVHDVRVASRRLLSALEVIETWARVQKIKAAKKELKQLLKIFSPVRDVHVQLLLLKKHARSGPAVKRLNEYLRDQQQNRIRKAAKKVRNIKPKATRKLMKGMRQWSGLITFAGAADLDGNLAALAKRSLGTRFEPVEALRRVADGRDIETLHQMRVAFKKYRYMAEFLKPILAKLTNEQLKRMHDYQTALGDIHDIDVLIATTRMFARKLRRSGPTTMRLGSTLRLLNQRKRKLIAEFVQHKDDLYEFWPFEEPISTVGSVQPISKETR